MKIRVVKTLRVVCVVDVDSPDEALLRAGSIMRLNVPKGVSVIETEEHGRVVSNEEKIEPLSIKIPKLNLKKHYADQSVLLPLQHLVDEGYRHFWLYSTEGFPPDLCVLDELNLLQGNFLKNVPLITYKDNLALGIIRPETI